MELANPRHPNVRRRDLPMQILERLLIEIVKFANRDCCHRPALRAFRSNGIRYRPQEWFERSLSVADRQAMSRAMRQLEDAGLVVRVMEPKRDRIAYVRPTVHGLLRSLDDGGVEVDLDALTRSLQYTWWGRDLTGVLEEDRVALGYL